LLAADAVRAHEFWLDPVKFRAASGETVPIVFRNGENLRGGTYPYVRALDRRFVVVDAKGERRIKTLDGDDPAAEVRLRAAGLSIVAHHRAAETVVYKSFAHFEESMKEEGLEAMVAQQLAARGATAGLRESYVRCAKALIEVGGTGSDGDRAIGLPIEIVAEQDPYRVGAGGTLKVRVLFKGAPLAGVMVRTLHRDDPLSPRRVRTDADGRAEVPLALAGEYLLSAVHALPASDPKRADLETYWASTTFLRP
jgi:uncharacterized GH25 family protein